MEAIYGVINQMKLDNKATYLEMVRGHLKCQNNQSIAINDPQEDEK